MQSRDEHPTSKHRKQPLRALAACLLPCCLALLALHLFAQQPDAPLQLFTTTHPAMGTTFTLYLYSTDPTEAAAISDEVFEQIDQSDQQLSNYRSSSELSRINRLAATQTLTTDPDTFDFLEQSLHWSRVSDGAFDITVGKLMKSWGFYLHQGRIPASSELATLRAATGWQKVQLDPQARTVHFTAPGVELDPGGIGKGFAVDAAVRILRADHVSAALLSAGSSTLYALGSPPHRDGWRISIPGPLPRPDELSSITLKDTSLSSADCTQKNFRIAGHLYCHIMDPRTLKPVEGRIQVTIVDPSATASDALSNVLFVNETARGLEILKAHAPEARALIVSGDPAHAHCTAFRWTDTIDQSHCTVN